MIQKITLDLLKEKGVCKEAVNWFKRQKKSEPLEVLEALISENKLSWASWSIVRLMTYEQYVSYAVFSAEQVIGIFEKKYPEDTRPRKAIEAAKECIEDPSIKNKKLAAAAYAAAYAAANTAANDAASAASAAYVAAYASRTKMQLKILNYGMRLLKKINLSQPIGGEGR